MLAETASVAKQSKCFYEHLNACNEHENNSLWSNADGRLNVPFRDIKTMTCHEKSCKSNPFSLVIKYFLTIL